MLETDHIPSIERGGAVPHLSLPHRAIVAWHEQEDGESIRAFVDRNRLEDGPPIVVYELDDEGNPKALLRAEWHRPIAEVRPLFVSCPMGGGGGGGGSKSVLGVVGMIALMAVASFVGGSPAVIAAIGKFGAGLLSAAIMVGGGLLLSHFMRPKAPATPAPTYDFQLGNNAAKPGQPIPVHYGRLKFMPDFADAPWSDFSGLDQTYHALLCLGVGEFDIEEIGVNTTPIWTANGGFSDGFGGAVSGAVQAHTGESGDTQGAGGDVQFQMIGPGGTVKLFPSNIAASPDVSGQELPEPYGTVTNGVTKVGPNGETSGPDKVGPFVINAAGTVARAIAIDLSWPGGMYHTGSGGSYNAGQVRIVCEYQYVDDQGHAVGNWATLFDKTWTFMSRSPWRETVKTDIAPGRVQVRLYRAWGLDKDGQTGVNWIGARAYVDGPSSRANVTQLAIQAKADKLLSGYSSQRLYVIATRRIPVWNAGSASWVTQATRNPFWAMADLWADTRYGGGQSRNKLDIPTFAALAASADTRGDYFDHRFASRGALVEHLTICAQSALAQPLPLWDTLSAVRDERRALPRTVLTDFEIIRGSLRMSYKISPANPTDGIVGQYFDNTTWAMQEVSSTGTVANLQNPSRVVMEGVTDRNQAFRNAIYLDRVNRYRRASMSLEIEGEGRLLKRGDYVVVASELPGTWGASVRVDAYDLTNAATRNLTLHTALDWSASGQRYIRIKGPHGEAFGPVKCGRYQSDNRVVIDATDLASVQTQQGLLLADILWRPDNAELPSAVISIGAPQEFAGLVHEIAPGSQEGHLRIDLAPYAADLIYADPTATLTPLPAAPALALPTVPGTIQGLGASLSQDDGAFTLTLNASWQPDTGSDSYEAQYSLDQAAWSGIYSGAAATFSIGGFSGSTLYLRVRGRRGNLTSVYWSQVTVSAPELTISLTNLGTYVSYDDIAPTVVDSVHLAQVQAIQEAEISAANAQVAGLIASVQTAARVEAAQTGVTIAQKSVSDLNSAFASYQITVAAAYATQTALASYLTSAVAATTYATQSALSGSVASINTNLSSNYVTNSSLATTLGSYSTTATIANTYATKTSVDEAISSINTNLSSNYVTNSALTSALSSYSTSATISQTYATQSSVNSSISAINTNLSSNYVTNTSLATTLGSYPTSATVSSTYATISGLNSAVSTINTNLSSNYVTNSALTSALSSYPTTATISSTYATKSYVDGSFASFGNTMAATYTPLSAMSSYATTASLSNYATTSALAGYATVGTVSAIEAKTNAGTAYGKIAFVAQSSLDSGVSAAYEIQVSATGATGTFSSAGLALEVLSGGGSRIVLTSDELYIRNGSTKTVPFGANSDGTLTLNGVTKVGTTIQSTATTSSGQPVMALDFVNGSISIWDNT